MASLQHYHTRFSPGGIYHIYNRSVNGEHLFRSAENFHFFLRKVKEYLSPVLDVYAYWLLDNHFHLLVRIKEYPEDDHLIVANRLKKLFQSYAMAFNRQENRVGTLFQRPFKRVLVDTDVYFVQLIRYIHLNPQRHGLTKDFRQWAHSSYHAILSDRQTQLLRDEILELFDGKRGFEQYHLAAADDDLPADQKMEM